MNILHVSQGLPPFRVGGLTKYCMDLMAQQRQEGHKVSLLHPGNFSVGSTRIKKTVLETLTLYSIINPLPLSLVFGIRAPERYQASCVADCYTSLLSQHSFDIIHVHCIQGIHKEFFVAANQVAIPMVFTTHDYYPFCFKCSLVDNTGEMCAQAGGAACRECNAGSGLSRWKEWLMQSSLYDHLKYHPFIARLRQRSRKHIERETSIEAPRSTPEKYQQLLDYYQSIIKTMSFLHCNSTVSYTQYHTRFAGLPCKILPISEQGLPSKPQQPHSLQPGVFHIGYFGGHRTIKGFHLMWQALQQAAEKTSKTLLLHLYGDDYSAFLPSATPHAINEGTYDHQALTSIFHRLDLVVVPSLWQETFGYLALEAIASGTPVIVSNRVGAQDLLAASPMQTVFPPHPQALSHLMLHCLANYNSYAAWFFHHNHFDTMQSHSNRITTLYKQLQSAPQSNLSGGVHSTTFD